MGFLFERERFARARGGGEKRKGALSLSLSLSLSLGRGVEQPTDAESARRHDVVALERRRELGAQPLVRGAREGLRAPEERERRGVT